MVPSPATRHPAGALNRVPVISPDGAWAVGSAGYNNTLVLHWNGTSWS